jgi:hypothetical protein
LKKIQQGTLYNLKIFQLRKILQDIESSYLSLLWKRNRQNMDCIVRILILKRSQHRRLNRYLLLLTKKSQRGTVDMPPTPAGRKIQLYNWYN